ncbi:MAG: 30S ribosomal protein S4e [Candidatus Woesearchaeota archaeon]|nr:30S ribosomal protein S4e [Candidatus Woesearchaeota archaeon]
MAHVKRLSAPKAWRLNRKEQTFTVKPSAGPQKYEHALAITVVLRDMLKEVRTTRECKKIMQEGKILINGKKRKDHRFPVGIFDIISIPVINENFIMLYDKTGHIHPQKISKEEADHKVVKIIGKKMLAGKKIQINLFDGRNILVDKGDYRVGDTILLTADNKIKKHLKFEKGATIYLIGGKHKGTIGTLEEIKPMEGIQSDRIIFKTKEGKIETLQEYAYIIEKAFTH